MLATASLFNGHPVIALAAAILLSLVAGALVYVFLMRKMTGEMVLAAILTTVALGILIRGLVVLIWSAQQQYPAQALGVPNPSLVLFGGARISLWSAVLVATTVAVYARCLLSCASAAGVCACVPPGRTHYWRRSAASICTAYMRWHGACRRLPGRSRAF